MGADARSTFDHALGNRAMRYTLPGGGGVSRAKLDEAKAHPLYATLLSELERTWPCDKQKIELACDVLLGGSGFELKADAEPDYLAGLRAMKQGARSNGFKV